MTSRRYSAGPDPDPALRAWLAAKDFIRAADRVRLAWQWTVQTYGAGAIDHDPLPTYHRPGGARWVYDAHDRCVALGVWRERWTVPRRFVDPVLLDARCLRLVRVRESGPSEVVFSCWVRRRRDAA